MFFIETILTGLVSIMLCMADTGGTAQQIVASAGTVTDIDGNAYQTVKIGTQVWMAENLRVTKYNDGTAIPLDTSKATWSNAETPKYCFYKNTTATDNNKKYGALYNWYVVRSANPKKIACAGWHVPSDAEWDTLQNCLIAKGYKWDGTIRGNKIAKSLTAKTEWSTTATMGTIGCDLTKNNTSGFSAFPGGYRDYNGSFGHQGYYGFWWSATAGDESSAYGRFLYCDSDSLDRDIYRGDGRSCGFSVRLLKNY
jgi:uncharacterized protein (TIGR02145 family)